MVSFLQVTLPRNAYASRQLRRTVAAWVAQATGLSADASAGVPRIVWADQNLPRPVLPYISLRLVTSVSDSEQTHTLASIPILTRVTVTATAVGEAARITLGFGSPGYVVQDGDAITDVRDGLIAAIEDRPDAVTCTVVDDDAFTVAGMGFGLAWPLDAIEGVTVEPVTLADVEVTETTRTNAVQIQCFGFTEPDAMALDYIDTLIADLGRAGTADFFAERGCSVVGLRPTAVDISALSSAERESRAYFDLQIAQWTRHTSGAVSLASAKKPTIELERPAA